VLTAVFYSNELTNDLPLAYEVRNSTKQYLFFLILLSLTMNSQSCALKSLLFVVRILANPVSRESGQDSLLFGGRAGGRRKW
jgi:hypothetical protein